MSLAISQKSLNSSRTCIVIRCYAEKQIESFKKFLDQLSLFLLTKPEHPSSSILPMKILRINREKHLTDFSNHLLYHTLPHNTTHSSPFGVAQIFFLMIMVCCQCKYPTIYYHATTRTANWQKRMTGKQMSLVFHLSLFSKVSSLLFRLSLFSQISLL